MIDILEFLKIIIAFMSFYAACWYFADYKGTRHRLVKRFEWEKLAIGFMFLYWSAYYICAALGCTAEATHQIWVRIPFLITIVLIGTEKSMSVLRHRRSK
jgi:hypothetical protein